MRLGPSRHIGSCELLCGPCGGSAYDGVLDRSSTPVCDEVAGALWAFGAALHCITLLPVALHRFAWLRFPAQCLSEFGGISTSVCLAVCLSVCMYVCIASM